MMLCIQFGSKWCSSCWDMELRVKVGGVAPTVRLVILMIVVDKTLFLYQLVLAVKNNR